MYEADQQKLDFKYDGAEEKRKKKKKQERGFKIL